MWSGEDDAAREGAAGAEVPAGQARGRGTTHGQPTQVGVAYSLKLFALEGILFCTGLLS